MVLVIILLTDIVDVNTVAAIVGDGESTILHIRVKIVYNAN